MKWNDVQRNNICLSYVCLCFSLFLVQGVCWLFFLFPFICFLPSFVTRFLTPFSHARDRARAPAPHFVFGFVQLLNIFFQRCSNSSTRFPLFLSRSVFSIILISMVFFIDYLDAHAWLSFCRVFSSYQRNIWWSMFIFDIKSINGLRVFANCHWKLKQFLAIQRICIKMLKISYYNA